MAETLMTSLSGMLDRTDVRRMTNDTDAPTENILHGYKAALASILAGIAGKVYDPGVLSQVFDLVALERSSTLSTSSEFARGQHLLALVLGKDRTVFVDEIGERSSLTPGVVAQIMDLAAPMVLILLGRRVQEQRIRLASFPKLLLQETGDLSDYLPASLSHLFRPPQPTFADVNRGFASASAPARSSRSKWMSVALTVVLILGAFWILREPPPAGMPADATRARTTPAAMGNPGERELPGAVHLRMSEDGIEAKLIDYIRDSSRTASKEEWFDFDRLTFEANSAIPEPQSEEQLANIASILRAYPRVRLKIGGFTDNIGNRQANQRLSENRAASVYRELVGMGIEFSRLEAEGYGDLHPIADNSTEQGRAKNRRLAVKVLQK